MSAPQWVMFALSVAAIVAIVAINLAQRREGEYDASDDNDRGMR